MLCLAVGWGGGSNILCAELDWTIKNQLNLDASPLDVAISSDGQWIFILIPERVLVYSSSEYKVVKDIPVEKKVDRLGYSPRNQTLVLSSGSGKTVTFIELESIHEFDLSGLPFKGPENAAVTIAVFGDYQ